MRLYQLLLLSIIMSLTPELISYFPTYFKRCVRGYHVLNKDPIKESVWETVNALILVRSGCSVLSQSNGSHSSGSDISSSIGNFSNKSVKYDKKTRTTINISSYRLTSVCNAGHPGTIPEIIEEIQKRKNFDYYSIIARDEGPNNIIYYEWLLLPSDHASVDPSQYEWSPLVGQRGKNKDCQIGWKTNVVNGSSMSITFSLSSQLWINICLEEGLKEQYVVASTELKVFPVIDYIDLSDSYPEEKEDA